MTGKAHRISRMATGIALAATIAALTAPAALAGGNRVVDGRSPDTRDAAMATHDSFYALDPAIARAIAAHQQSLTPSDGRSPDTRDAALQAHNPVATFVKSNGFDWGDFGIGVGVAIGSMLMLAGLAAGVLAVRQSQKTGPAATA